MKELRVGQVWKYIYVSGRYGYEVITEIGDDCLTLKTIGGTAKVTRDGIDEWHINTFLSDPSYSYIPAYNTPLWKILNGDNNDSITSN